MNITDDLELAQNNLSECARRLPLYNYTDILDEEGIEIIG